MQAASDSVRADGDIGVSRARWAWWAIGLALISLTAPADAQNIDAGKSPAQIFSDTCSACHRRPQELRRTSAGFLRSHYTTGAAEAAAMAGYLASVPADPRAQQQQLQQKRQPGITPPEAIPTRRQEPREQPKEQPKEQAKSTQTPGVSSKSRRSGNAEAKAPAAVPPPHAPEVKPPEPAPEAAPPPPPPLEPFEE
jgi:hypothetical protein